LVSGILLVEQNLVASVDREQILGDLEKADGELAEMVTQPDAVRRLLITLREKFPLSQPIEDEASNPWNLSGLSLQVLGRVHEALAIHWAQYQGLIEEQKSTRLHKGTPLVRISDCFRNLGYPVHAKRYLMLTLCEDAIQGEGEIPTQSAGVYFRLIWSGVPHEQLERYAAKFFELYQKAPEDGLFPEALLQALGDDDWLTELPSANEALFYRVNPEYVARLLARLGMDAGVPLEQIAGYLMSCMAGCRTTQRLRSPSTDYDVVCAMEGFELDFRSEFGRHFVCECKDWQKPADFSTMAKFCRVLDGAKSRFGILFSKNGISGEGGMRDAALEQLKIFQDRGVIIVVLNKEDLRSIQQGANLVALLRRRYEDVRLNVQRTER
jgi:hypothetical protein